MVPARLARSVVIALVTAGLTVAGCGSVASEHGRSEGEVSGQSAREGAASGSTSGPAPTPPTAPATVAPAPASPGAQPPGTDPAASSAEPGPTQTEPEPEPIEAGPGPTDAGPGPTDPGLPAWQASTSAVTAERLGDSWRQGCPVGPDDLRLVTLRHVGFDGGAHTGEIIVHEDLARAVRDVFRDLYEARFPIRRMRTIEVYDGDDDASMADDNTSGFNCRPVAGGTRWSRHAYGRAIDVNPLENPYAKDGTVLPPAGRQFLDRSRDHQGMIHARDEVVDAFARRGFGWGGNFVTLVDYQHFHRE